MWHSLGGNKIKHCSETATLIPFRNRKWNNTWRLSSWRENCWDELIWGKDTELESDLNYSCKERTSGVLESQDGCTENWPVLAACLKPQVCQHRGCGGRTAPGTLCLWAALPWMSTDTLLCRGFLKKPDTNSFFCCFSRECCKELVFPAVNLPGHEEVWERSLCWPKGMDKASQSFPNSLKGSWLGAVTRILPYHSPRR